MKAIVNPFLRKGSFLAACPPSEGVTFPCRLTARTAHDAVQGDIDRRRVMQERLLEEGPSEAQRAEDMKDAWAELDEKKVEKKVEKEATERIANEARRRAEEEARRPEVSRSMS